MAWNGIGSLDLSNVNPSGDDIRLKPGRHVCRITKAEIKDTNDGAGKRLALEFVAVDGAGSIQTGLNVYLPRSPEAMEISKRNFKALLIGAGMPADRLNDVRLLVGKTVGVNVEESEYADRKTGEKKRGTQVRDRAPFFKPDGEAGAPAPAAMGGGKSWSGDEIPFAPEWR